MEACSRKERRIERVVRVMVGEDDVGDLVWRIDKLPKRTQDGGRVGHHARIDNHPYIVIADEANRAGSVVPDITRKENPELGLH